MPQRQRFPVTSAVSRFIVAVCPGLAMTVILLSSSEVSKEIRLLAKTLVVFGVAEHIFLKSSLWGSVYMNALDLFFLR